MKVLITGGTGTFGRAFVEHLLRLSYVDRVIVFSRDELKQSQMQAARSDERLRYFLGDVRDLPRLRRAFQGVDYVVHAAALKRIEVGEYNPGEVIKTNVQGTANVIEAAIDARVHRVVLLSSDKACAPVNLYGASKLVAEKLMLAAHAYAHEPTWWEGTLTSGSRPTLVGPAPRIWDGKTSFCVVRYGNVSASRGSVIEIWRRALLEDPSPALMVTDPEATRFFMLPQQACELVEYALTKAPPNTITVPRLRAYRVADLLEAIAPGATPVRVGLRPGEKMHEVMISADEVGAFAHVSGTDYLQGPAAGEELRLMSPLSSDRALRMGVEEIKQELAKL